MVSKIIILSITLWFEINTSLKQNMPSQNENLSKRCKFDKKGVHKEEGAKPKAI